MKVDIIMPQMGESIAEGTISKWFKTVGDSVSKDEPILEISTDKVDAEIPSPEDGTLIEVHYQQGDTVPVNTVIGILETAVPQAIQAIQASDAPSNQSGKLQTQSESPITHAGSQEGAVRSSPLVRRLAREHNVDLQVIQGTGLSGRITKRDVMRYIKNRSDIQPWETATEASESESVYTEPMTLMRRTIAERMILSRRTSAHVTTVFEIEMTRVSKTRDLLKKSFVDQHHIKLTYLPFIVQACVRALKAFPILNASISEDSIIYKKHINIGIAVALEWGLIVPVLRHAEEKSLLGLAKGIQDLADRARQKRLTPSDVQGGTFTITNPGAFGSLFGTPIINQPQVAILGVGSITKRPIVIEDDAITVRPMAYFSLSFDHRLIDGAVGDQFMSHIKRSLEDWTERDFN